MAQSILDLLSVRRGHFSLESGMHGDVWFDLEPLFLQPSLLASHVAELAKLLLPSSVDGVCGAMVGGALVGYQVAAILKTRFFYAERLVLEGGEVAYRLPGPLRAAVRGLRLAVVDDAINAGSAVTRTHGDLVSAEAQPVVFASLLTVGGAAPKKLAGYPEVVSLEHLESSLWEPATCPLCRSRVPLTDPYPDERKG